jgi:archaellum component FlaC
MLKIAIDEQGVNIGKGIGEGIANGAGAELSEEIKKSLGLLRDVADEFNTLTNQVKDQSATIKINFNEAQISSAQISSSFQEIPSQSNQLKEAASTLKDAATHAATSISQIIQENAIIASRWQDIGSLVQRIDQSLAIEVQKTTDIFPQYAENLRSFSDVLQKSMTQSLAGLSANIKDLESSHEHLKEQSSIWRESATAVASSAETVSSHLNHFVHLVESQKNAIHQLEDLTNKEKMNPDSDLRNTTSPE